MESAVSRIELVGQCAGVRDPHRRRPFQCRAMRVQRRPVQDSITCSTMPAGAPATACPTQATWPTRTWLGPSGCPLRQRVGGWMIQVPAAVYVPARPHSTEHMLRRRMRSATYPADDPAAGAVLTAW